MTELKESIRFYESQLEDKVIAEAMESAIKKSSVGEATDLNMAYVDLLISRYKDTLEIIYLNRERGN